MDHELSERCLLYLCQRLAGGANVLLLSSPYSFLDKRLSSSEASLM